MTIAVPFNRSSLKEEFNQPMRPHPPKKSPEGMTTLLRVKRKCEAEPLDYFVIEARGGEAAAGPCAVSKKPRLQMFTFKRASAHPFASNDGSLPPFPSSTSLALLKDPSNTYELLAVSVHHRYTILELESLASTAPSLHQQLEQLSLAPAAPAARPEGYVYDLYLPEPAPLETERLAPHWSCDANECEYLYDVLVHTGDGLAQDEDEMDDDDEDSNAEDYYANDYPEEPSYSSDGFVDDDDDDDDGGQDFNSDVSSEDMRPIHSYYKSARRAHDLVHISPMHPQNVVYFDKGNGREDEDEVEDEDEAYLQNTCDWKSLVRPSVPLKMADVSDDDLDLFEYDSKHHTRLDSDFDSPLNDSDPSLSEDEFNYV